MLKRTQMNPASCPKHELTMLEVERNTLYVIVLPSSIFSSGKAALWSETSKIKRRLYFQATLARIHHMGVAHYHQVGSDSMVWKGENPRNDDSY
ncbi:hypothetical protein SDC9_133292 [bioreactor metagenome]|uniref:Uncharacterized protein n=1 Tax=bioreactor metagenome TaxID=1076179 RepID=A0A645DA38_9ZZZZ